MNDDFPRLKAVLSETIPDMIIAEWSGLAAQHSASGFYASFLSFEKMVPWSEGGEHSCAVANTAPYARVLEDGHSGMHLPSKIDWAKAAARGTAKRSKRGTHYLSIPFRHYTPGSGGVGTARARAMMPRSVYRDALAALRGDPEQKKTQNAAARLRAAGTQLSRHYTLMHRQIGAFPVGLWSKAMRQEGQPGYTWRSRTYEGLTRREQHAPLFPMLPGAGRSTGASYFTFRTLSEDSAGWYIPPMAGFRFAEQAAERVRGDIRELIGEAVRADFAVEAPVIHVRVEV